MGVAVQPQPEGHILFIPNLMFPSSVPVTKMFFRNMTAKEIIVQLPTFLPQLTCSRFILSR